MGRQALLQALRPRLISVLSTQKRALLVGRFVANLDDGYSCTESLTSSAMHHIYLGVDHRFEGYS